MRALGAVAFDLDGTLVDTADAHGEAYRLAFASFGVEIAAADFRVHAGKHHSEIIPLLAGHARRAIDPTELHARKTEFFEELAPRAVRALPLVSLMISLHGTLPIALVTSATRRTALASLAASGGASIFDVIVTADDIARHKPDPEPFLLASERLGCRPSSILVFEDSDSGVESARQAGCIVVRVAPPGAIC